MGGLAHFLEDEGLSTVHISLIRLHTEQIKPPRALWVPFELGRPFGPPDNPAFQTRVLLAALELYAAESGPVLHDFEEDAPQSAEGPAVWACPINLPAPPEDGDRNMLLKAFKNEIARLAPWYDLARDKRGRTTMGASGLDPDALADFICGLINPDPPQNPIKDVTLDQAIRLTINDLKAYYLEAASAQPGHDTSTGRQLADWFWLETTAGKVLQEVKKALEQSKDDTIKFVGGLMIVPRSYLPAQG